MEPNASEPLMRCRKRRNDVKTGGKSLLRDQVGGYLLTARSASGIKAAGTRSGLLRGTWEPVVLMTRETRKRQNRERLSTNAAHRDGVASSSDEGPVMGPERRGHLNRCGRLGQPESGGPRSRMQPVGRRPGDRRASVERSHMRGDVHVWF